MDKRMTPVLSHIHVICPRLHGAVARDSVHEQRNSKHALNKPPGIVYEITL